jgi:hypothetical protein
LGSSSSRSISSSSDARPTNDVRGAGRFNARLDRLQQWEVAREPVDLELVDALGGSEILEAVHAQVADL